MRILSRARCLVKTGRLGFVILHIILQPWLKNATFRPFVERWGRDPYGLLSSSNSNYHQMFVGRDVDALSVDPRLEVVAGGEDRIPLVTVFESTGAPDSRP
jgi:hypothetical protein